MAWKLKNAQSGNTSETTSLLEGLAAENATVLFQVVRHDGAVEGNNGTYDVVTVNLAVIVGDGEYELHERIQVTGKGITPKLVHEEPGEVVATTLELIPSKYGKGKEFAAANPVDEETFAAIAAMVEKADPFAKFAKPAVANARNDSATAATSGATKPGWMKKKG